MLKQKKQALIQAIGFTCSGLNLHYQSPINNYL